VSVLVRIFPAWLLRALMPVRWMVWAMKNTRFEVIDGEVRLVGPLA